MKRFWLFSLSLLMMSSVTMTSFAVQDWNQPSLYGTPSQHSGNTDPSFFGGGGSQPGYRPGNPNSPRYQNSMVSGQAHQVGPAMQPAPHVTSPYPPQVPQGYRDASHGHGPEGMAPHGFQPGINPQGGAPQGYQPSPSSIHGSGYYSAPSILAPSIPGYSSGNEYLSGSHSANMGGCDGGPGSYGMNYASPSGGYGAGGYSGHVNSGCAPGGGNRFVGPGYQNAYGSNCNTGGPGASYFASQRATKTRNLVGGIGGLVFFRDLEDDLGLSANGAGDALFSTSATNDAMGGVEGFLQSRNCNGRGWEARYWGLYPNSVSSSIAGMPYSALGGLSQITHGPTGDDALMIYDQAASHVVTRRNQFHNVELSRLINAGTITGLGCAPVNYELLHGARWFEFDEDFQYSALSGVWMPNRLDYNVNVDNTLMGYQFGGRSTRCLTKRLQLISGLKFGLYNNRIRHRQFIEDENMNIAFINSGPSTGRPYDYSSSKNDLSTLTEAEAGLAYMLSSSARISFGYRVLGVTGLALAPDQVPYNFTDAMEIERIRSNGSLLLHGFYGGLNLCF